MDLFLYELKAKEKKIFQDPKLKKKEKIVGGIIKKNTIDDKTCFQLLLCKREPTFDFQY